MTDSEWCTIESDPGVFSTMLREFGVSGIQVEELWSLDESAYMHLKPIHAVIFLFKYDQKIVAETHKDSTPSTDTKIFFAKQHIHNACATQAIINACMNFNKDTTEIELGTVLQEFKEFVNDFDSDFKGISLSNSDKIRTIHNSYARQTVFEVDKSMMRTKKEDPFHFVTYLPINGRLVELDGLQSAPIDHGEITNAAEWVKQAQTVLEKRMQLYGTGEIRFNLMGIVADRKKQLEKQMAVETEKENFDADVVCEIQAGIEAEDNKFERYERENVLRKHNFLPMIIEHLKIMSENGSLLSAMEKAEVKKPAVASAQ